MKILLDTNIILLDATVLARKKKNVSLIVPFPVRLELATTSFVREGISSIVALLDLAVKKEIVQIYRLATVPSFEVHAGLSKTDIELITAAQELYSQGEDVRLATEDKQLGRAVTSLGIQTIDLKQLNQILSTDSELDMEIVHEGRRIFFSQLRAMMGQSLGGTAASVLAIQITINWQKIIATVPIWGTIALVVLSGLVLYAMRGRFRFLYGVFEFMFGIIFAVKVFWPHFELTKLSPIDLLQVLAGIYIMVRGQDNIGNALKGTRFGLYWRLFSGDQ